MRTLLAVLVLAPGAALAQSMTDATLCDRWADSRYPDARPRVEQLARGSGAQATFMQGCVALQEGKAERAADLFEQTLRANEGSAVTHFFLGRALGEQAQRANVFRQASLARKTKTHFDRAVQLDPDYLDARQGLMQYYLIAPGIMGGSKEKAREQAAEIQRRNAYRGAFALASIPAREKRWGETIRIYQQLTTQYPDSAAPWTSLALAHGQAGQWTEAFAVAERMQRAMPNAALPGYVVGRLAIESGQQLERGEQGLRRYLGTPPRPGEPSLAVAHWRLGAVLERQGKRDQARAEYEAALKLDGNLKGAREALKKLG